MVAAVKLQVETTSIAASAWIILSFQSWLSKESGQASCRAIYGRSPGFRRSTLLKLPTIVKSRGHSGEFHLHPVEISPGLEPVYLRFIEHSCLSPAAWWYHSLSFPTVFVVALHGIVIAGCLSIDRSNWIG
jgi:hypothetical protein